MSHGKIDDTRIRTRTMNQSCSEIAELGLNLRLLGSLLKKEFTESDRPRDPKDEERSGVGELEREFDGDESFDPGGLKKENLITFPKLFFRARGERERLRRKPRLEEEDESPVALELGESKRINGCWSSPSADVSSDESDNRRPKFKFGVDEERRFLCR